VDRPLPVPQVVVPIDYRVRHRNRPRNQDCYLNAANYAIRSLDLPGVRVVHGTYRGGLNHAWAEIDLGDSVVVFDPNWRTFHDREVWRVAVMAVEEKSFTPHEVCLNVSASRHTGPWEAWETWEAVGPGETESNRG